MYDVSAIKVKNVTSGAVGRAITFLVETSQAGPGNLEVTVNSGRVSKDELLLSSFFYLFSSRNDKNGITDYNEKRFDF